MGDTHTSNGNYQGLNTNYAIQNKFVCYVPISNVLGRTFKDLELNITKWTLPQINIGSTSVQYKSYTYALPTHVMNAEDRELTIEYIVDHEWKNYSALYVWAVKLSPIVSINDNDYSVSKVTPNKNKPDDIYSDPSKTLIDIRIWLINNYKKRILDFVYHNCWISQFTDLAMDVTSTSEIKHSFTCKYSHFTIEKPVY